MTEPVGPEMGLVRLEVGPVAHGGHCVARLDGRVVFVRHALPGETVLARLMEHGDGKRFWRADAVEVLAAAPGRVSPPCPVAGPGGCGGCDWQHADPATRRELKHAVVAEQLHRLAGLEPDFTVEAMPGPDVDGHDDGLGWRTRVRFAVDGQGRPGFRRHRSHDVVPVPAAGCPIAHRSVNAVGLAGQRLSGVAAADVVTSSSGEALVVLEPAAGRRARPPEVPDGTGVAVRQDGEVTRLRGRARVTETVTVVGAPRPFRVSGTGFWQVHPAAAQTWLDAVLDAAAPRPGESALDLYSGVGLFAAGLAVAVGPGGSVLAVESDARSGADARRNLHDLPQVRCLTARVDAVLESLTSADATDVVVLDPPRTGAGPAVMRRLAGLAPRVVVYVACDPAALARDLAAVAEAGYGLAGLRVFDAFPMTHHVECIARIEPLR